MSKEIDNRITKMDLDGSGFISGAKQVQSAIAGLEDALQFKGAAKGAESVTSAIDDMQKSISSGTQEMASDFANVADAMTNSLSNAASEVAANAQKIGAAMGSEIQNATSTADSAFGVMAAGISAKIASIVKTAAVVGAIAGGIALTVGIATGSIGEKISSVVDGVKNKLSEAKSWLSETLDGGIEGLKTKFDTVKEKVSNAGEEIKKAVKPVIEDLKTTLQTAFPETYDIVAPAIDKLVEKIKGIKSAAEEALSTVQFLAKGITDKLKEPLEKVSGAFGRHKKDIQQAGEELGKYASDLSKVVEAAKNSADALNDTGDAAKGSADALGDAAAAGEDAAQSLGDTASAGADASQSLSDTSQSAEDASSGMEDAAAAGEDTSQALGDIGQSAADAAEGLNDASGAGENASSSLGDAGQNAADAAEGLREFGEGSKEGAEGAKEVSEESEKAAENMEKTGEAAESSGNRVKGIFETLGTFIKALGHDLGELPFKFDEIAEKGGTVGKVVSAGLEMAFDKLKELAGVAIPLALSGIGEKLGILKGDMDGISEGAEKSSKSMEVLGSAAEAVGGKFSALGAIAFGALERIGQKAVDVGANLLKSLTVDQVSEGFNEYELKMNSIQTIMSGTGESLSTVSKYLDELNTYADKTIYKFSDMTSNIGKFTNQGVGLQDAVDAIRGICNEAALAGATTQQASHAMYNFAQAMSLGYVGLVDWRSIENAMMATKEFKQTLIDTGLELKTLKQSGDKVVSLTKDGTGHVSDLFDATKGFRDSLKSQWLTNEVLVETLKKYSDESTDFGRKAVKAAQDIKTFTQLMDTLKESVGSNWAKTFELIIGDFNEAKELWTGVSDLITPIIYSISDARNALLEGWRALGGREDVIASLKSGFENFVAILKAAKEGLETFLPPITATRIKELTDSFGNFIDKIKLNKEQLGKVEEIFEKISQGVKNAKDAFKEITDKISDFVNKSGALDILKTRISELFGSKDIFSKNGLLEAISNAISKLNEFAQSKVFQTIKDHAEDIGRVFTSVVQLGSALVTGLGQVFSSLGGLFGKLGQVVIDHLDDICTFIDGAVKLVSGAVDALAAIITTKLDSWSNWLPTVLGLLLDVVGKVGEALAKLGQWMSEHAETIAAFVKAFLLIKTLGTVVPILLKAMSVIVAIVNAIKKFGTIIAVVKTVVTVLKTVPAALELIALAAKGPIGALASFALKALSLVAPVTAATAAIVALGIALYAAYKSEKKHQEQLKSEAEALYGLTDTQKEFAKQVQDTSEAYDRLYASRDASIKDAETESQYYQKLASDLREIADESGKVKDGKEELAKYIISELNGALGLELGLVDGQITGYAELNGVLDDTIEKKKLLAMINAGKEDYQNALYNQDTLSAEETRANRDLKNAENNLAGEMETLSGLVEAYNKWEREHYGEDALLIPDANNVQYAKTAASFNNVNPYADAIEQTATNIETLDGLINVGTAEIPSLKETAINAHEAVINNAEVISNYEGLTEALDGTPEEREKAINDYTNHIKHSGDEGVTLSTLKNQKDKIEAEYGDRLDMLNEGLIKDDDLYLETLKAGLDSATDEYSKQFQKEYGKYMDSKEKTTAESLKAKKESYKQLAADKKAGYVDEEKRKPQTWDEANKNMPWKEAFTEEKDPIKEGANSAVKSAAKAIEEEVEEQKNTTLGEKILGAIFGSIGTGLDIIDGLFPGLFTKAEASGVETGETIAESTVEGIEANAGAIGEAGGTATESYVDGGKANAGAATAFGGTLPQNAAESAEANSGVMQPAGEAGVDAYNTGGESASPLAALMGALLPQNTASGAEGNASLIGAAGIAGVLGYISGGESASPMATILGALLTVLAAEGATSMIPEMESAGSNAADGFINSAGGADKLAAAYNAGAALGAAFNSGLTDTLKIESPSKVTYKDGEYTILGFVNALKKGRGLVRDAGLVIGETAENAISYPLANLSDLLNSDFDDAITITPVLDLSQIQNGAGAIGSMLDSAAARMNLSGFDVSGVMPKNDAERSGSDPTLNELKGLRQDMAKFNEKLGRLQVRMDKGALVGELADPMDQELGRRASLRGRR